MSVGAGSFDCDRRLSGTYSHPPGSSSRSRLLAERAAEHRLFRAAVPAAAERPEWVHTAALGLLLWLVSELLHTHRLL